MQPGAYSPTDAPNYLTAKTPQGLRKAMLNLNIRKATWHRFFDISQVDIGGKKMFIVWYSDPVSDNQALEDLQGSD